jgi:hypothetical protein
MLCRISGGRWVKTAILVNEKARPPWSVGCDVTVVVNLARLLVSTDGVVNGMKGEKFKLPDNSGLMVVIEWSS